MKNKDIPYYLSKYLKNYIIGERNLSNNTKRSYINTFQLLINYLINKENYKLVDITFANITREIIINFLNYLEDERKNSIRTRNQRLACLKSFYQFCLIEEIENVNNIQKILTIKFKKYPKKVIDYLTEDELKELLENIDTSTFKGKRNLMILVLMYDTAARSSEVVKIKVEDINLKEKYVILHGKGEKDRIVPIMEKTVEILKTYLKEKNIKDGYLLGEGHTYEIIRYLFEKIKKMYKNKNITAHTLRHTRAVHLLSAGINIMYLRDFLGHESVTTTEEYAKVLEKDKFEAIRSANVDNVSDNLEDWVNDNELLSQLLSL